MPMRPPGPVLRRLMIWRLGPQATEQLLGELGELYDVRHERQGGPAADRWLRRQHRRWSWHLMTGAVQGEAGRRPGGTSAGGHPPLSARLLATATPADRFRDHLADVRRGARSLLRAPLLSGAVVLTVGLGIGGTTLVWAAVHAVLVAPLPYPGADRMVLLRTIRGEDQWGTSMADVEAMYDAPPSAFDGMAAYRRGTASVMLGGEAQLLDTKWVTDSYFPLIGIQPILGRSFTPDEGRAGGSDVVLLTQGLWERAYGSDPDVLGRTVPVDGVPHTIVGVLPSKLGPLDAADLYPVLRVETPGRKGPFFFPIIGRLAPGVGASVAREQLADVSRQMFLRWQSSFPTEDAVLGFRNLKEAVVGDVARTLLLVLTATGFLLLVASANAAGLLVARGVARRRELAVRVAVGASRGRILRLVLTEAGLLALASGAVGLGLTWGGLTLLQGWGAGRLARVSEVAFTPPVAAFFVAVTVGSCLLLGGIAATSALRTGPVGRDGTRTTGSPLAGRVRRGLVAAQFAVAIPLLVAAGLLGRSLERMQSGGVGFDLDRIVSMQVALPEGGYPDEVSVRGFWDDVLPRLAAIPGVLEVGLADARPPVGELGGNNFVLEGEPRGTGAPQTQSTWITVSPGFFGVLDMRLIDGRLFAASSDTMRHAVVDRAWAERYVPGGSAVGRRFLSGGCTVDGCPFVEVVGVVETVKTTGLDDPGRGTIYYDFGRESYGSMFLHLRTQGAPLDVIPAVTGLLRQRDPSVPIVDVRSAVDVASESMFGRRATVLLVGLVAAVALLLSVVGIYGTMATFVRQNVREIGIRIALGAGPGRALRDVILDGLRVAGAGIVLGVIGALALSRYMGGLLYEVRPGDPVVFTSVCAVTVAVALIATAIPGRRAAATDPAVALRSD